MLQPLYIFGGPLVYHQELRGQTKPRVAGAGAAARHSATAWCWGCTAAVLPPQTCVLRRSTCRGAGGGRRLAAAPPYSYWRPPRRPLSHRASRSAGGTRAVGCSLAPLGGREPTHPGPAGSGAGGRQRAGRGRGGGRVAYLDRAWRSWIATTSMRVAARAVPL